MKATFRCICLLVSLLLSTSQIQAQLSEKKPYSLSWTDRGYQSRAPLLRITLADGIPRLFALDTGAPACMIASDVARMLKLPVQTHKFTRPSKSEGYEYIVSSASLGPNVLPLSDVPFPLVDMNVLRQFDVDTAGILGLNALRFFALRLDFQKLVVDFLYIEKIAGTEWEPKEAIRIPLLYNNEGYCFVEGEVDGKPVRFILDTGAPHTFLSDRSLLSSLKPKAKLRGYLNAAAADVATEIKVVPAQKLRLQTLKIGSAEWKEPVIETMMAQEDQINALGVDFLRRFRVIIDLPGRMLYLTPDPDFIPDEREWFGTGLDLGITAQKQVRVVRVVTPSPASASKVEEGEEVVSIDGHPVPDMKSEELATWWYKKQREAEEVVLELRKLGATKTRTLKVKCKKLL